MALDGHRLGHMRVALISPLYETVPPSHYGGTERVIAALADELVDMGHDVTLFAAGGSRTRASVVAVVPAPLRTTMSRRELTEIAPHLHLHMLAEVYRQAGEFDVIHAHTDIWTLPFVRLTETPTVVTMHGRLDLDAVQRVFPLYPDTPLVSISESQRRALDHFPIRWVGTVPNGLDLGRYIDASRRPRHRDYLAFIGRLTPEKRPDLAVEVARRAGLPLRVAAKIDPLDAEYWRHEIEPLFDREGVDYLGELSERDKPEFLAGARAMLLPIDWPEPFGLVMIESLAAGTPVVALRRGSVPEVITDGVSGWICDDVDEMVRRVHDVDRLDRSDCIDRAREFSATRMACRYLSVYRRLVNDSERASASEQVISTAAGA